MPTSARVIAKPMPSRRRCLVLGAALLAGGAAQPSRAQAPAGTKLVGALWSGSRDASADNRQAFVDGLAEAGWTPGQNCTLQERYADGDDARLPALANELVRVRPQVVFAPTTQATLAVRRVSAQVPVVFAVAADPVGSKLVDSLSRPGRRTTGVGGLPVDVGAKRIELLRECLERLNTVVLLKDAGAARDAAVYASVYRATDRLRAKVSEIAASSEPELRSAFAQMAASRPGGILVSDGPFFVGHRKLIVDSVAALNVPAVYPIAAYADEGGLMSYGVKVRDQYRRAAAYVGKILNGANADELPVDSAGSFELVINVKTANALGMKIPKIVLLRADRIVE